MPFCLTVGPLVGRNDLHRHAEFIRGVGQLTNEVASVPSRLSVEVGERLTLGLGDVKHRCGSESNEPLRPLFRRCLVVVTVAALVVARRVLALWALVRDDWCPDPDPTRPP